MIRRLSLAGFIVALASVASADTGANGVSTPEADAARPVEGDLDAFVETAIQNGLLVPNGAAEGQIEETSEAVVTPQTSCASEYPLDFSVVRNLRRFTQLPAASADADTVDETAKLAADLKAKLALGLYPEAKAMIASQPEHLWQTHRAFIELMDHRARPDPDYFLELAECFPDAGLWAGIAQLVVFDSDGVERIAAHTASIRTLPYALREDVATLIVPGLIIERRPDIAQLVLATFTPEEIDNSTRLGALKTAVVDMPNGSESDDRLVMLMSQPKLKLAALLILIERDGTLRPTVHSFVLEEAWRLLEETESHHNLDPIVEFVIKHLDSQDLRAGLQRVRSLSVADRPDVKASIEDYTIDAISDYLADEDTANAINALHTLNAFNNDLPVNPRGNELRKAGAQRALALGFFSMVKHLLEPVELDRNVGLMLAKAAFWSGVDQDLFDMRQAFPSEWEINRMAGIRALQADLPSIASAAFEGLAAHPSTQLELLEQGAIEDNWTLWTTNLAPLVAGLSDAEVVRLDRVRTIEKARRPAANPNARDIRPYQIADILSASRQRLSRPMAGANNEQ